jgi:hypothetical protein
MPGTFPFGSTDSVYYVFRTAETVTIVIDWKYGQDDGAGFAYKEVGATKGTDTGRARRVSGDADLPARRLFRREMGTGIYGEISALLSLSSRLRIIELFGKVPNNFR